LRLGARRVSARLATRSGISLQAKYWEILGKEEERGVTRDYRKAPWFASWRTRILSLSR
jgi:hypothetical protein